MRRLVLVGALCATAGCFEPDVVMCSNGLACPAGTLCDEIHLTCVSPDQLTVCERLAESADCSAGPVTGGCFDGVCLARGCGNRVLEAEAGEMCDDGNQTSLDGCRGDCLSTEVCGNGFLDPEEACDDDNLISRDGCDSRCLVEDAAWSIVPLGPAILDGRLTAYDTARERLVSVDYSSITWEWDGARWSADMSLKVFPSSVFYDPDQGEVRMIGAKESEEGLPGNFYVFALRDAKWVQVSGGDGPGPGTSSSVSGTYDAERHRLAAIELRYDGQPSAMWTLDSRDTWTRLEDFPGSPWSPAMAFDPATGHVLLEGDFQEFVYDGIEWTSSDTDFYYPSVAYDPSRGRLVLTDERRTLFERIGAEWQPIPGSEMPCRDSAWLHRTLYFNTETATLDLFSIDGTEICRWNGAWASVMPEFPSRIMGAAYDPNTRSFVLLHNAHPVDPDAAAETWTFDGEGWTRLETPQAPAGRRDPVALYSPGRAATVLYGGRTPYTCGGLNEAPCEQLQDAWTLDGSTWNRIAAPPLRDPSLLNAATYDAKRGRVVISAANELWSLSDREDEWEGLDTPDSFAPDVIELAWDSRNQSVVAARRIPGWFNTELVDFRDGVWSPVELVPAALLRPSAIITLASDERSGGVFALDTMNGAAWLRVGSSWVELPPLPLALSTWTTAYNPVDGSLLVVGDEEFSGRFAAVLTRSSATPLESCVSGEDLDGDGRAGCDDPDCYWACSTCLPHTTCDP